MSWIKNKIKKFPYLYAQITYLNNFRKNYWKPASIKDLNQALSILSTQIKDISFIQIGSNDGISGDPLHKYIIKYKWRGILIEPVPFIFEQLKNNYSLCQNLDFRNCAVGKLKGTMNLYAIDEQLQNTLPAWYFQLASFDKSMLSRHGIDDVEAITKTLTVNVETFDQIMKSSNILNLNLVHIDTEGFDYEILKMINFHVYKPEIIILEYRHLGVSNYKNAIQLLKKNEYKLFVVQFDILAIRMDFFKKKIKHLA